MASRWDYLSFHFHQPLIMYLILPYNIFHAFVHCFHTAFRLDYQPYLSYCRLSLRQYIYYYHCYMLFDSWHIITYCHFVIESFLIELPIVIAMSFAASWCFFCRAFFIFEVFTGSQLRAAAFQAAFHHWPAKMSFFHCSHWGQQRLSLSPASRRCEFVPDIALPPPIADETDIIAKPQRQPPGSYFRQKISWRLLRCVLRALLCQPAPLRRDIFGGFHSWLPSYASASHAFIADIAAAVCRQLRQKRYYGQLSWGFRPPAAIFSTAAFAAPPEGCCYAALMLPFHILLSRRFYAAISRHVEPFLSRLFFTVLRRYTTAESECFSSQHSWFSLYVILLLLMR